MQMPANGIDASAYMLTNTHQFGHEDCITVGPFTNMDYQSMNS